MKFQLYLAIMMYGFISLILVFLSYLSYSHTELFIAVNVLLIVVILTAYTYIKGILTNNY